MQTWENNCSRETFKQTFCLLYKKTHEGKRYIYIYIYKNTFSLDWKFSQKLFIGDFR